MNYPCDMEIQSCTIKDYMFYGEWDLEALNLKCTAIGKMQKKSFFQTSFENPITCISNMNDHCDKQDSNMYLNAEDPKVCGVQRLTD